ncbi:MAG: hypothetical protein MJ200_04175 [Mycoplasmoidaceae bacterium]|nr:hypothetical protein [Mycoplasmoidaceae bacterium]
MTILSKENGPLKLLGYDENDVVDTSYTETNKQVLYSFNYPLENFKPAPIYSDSIYLKKGEYIYIQGNNPEGWYEKIECQDKHHIGFNIEFKSDLQGSMMSLIDPTLSTKQIPFTDSEDEEAGFPCLFAGSNIETIGSKVLQVEDVLPPSCFRKTFYDCPNLINLGGVINLVVSLELKPHCCEDMFCMCTSIESLDGSKHMIPKNDYADSCYKNMFSSCVNLKEAPLVTRQDKDMKPHCLEGMFSFCRSLQSSQPVISASADKYCYAEMFEGCDSLIECPETDCIQIGSADQYCFYGMYKGCTVIKDIPELKKHI